MVTDTGTLNPEQMLQQQQILRQQKMAEMLMQQGMQQPQGQMISGRYVAPSIFQNLAGLANTYVGQRGIEKAEQAQVDLAKRLRADETSAMADFMQRKEAGNVDYANLYADPRASAAQRQFAFTKMNEGPIKVGVEDTLIDPRTMKPVFTGAGKPRAPLQIDTGTAIELRDPANPTIVLQRIPKSQMPTAGQVVERDDGTFLIDTRTGQARPVLGQGGKPLEGGGKPLTEAQGNSVAFGARAVEANRLATDLESKGVTIPGKTSTVVSGIAGMTPFVGEKYSEATKSLFNVLPEFAGGLSPEQQQNQQARRNFISAVLRKESGAAIGVDEYKNEERKYFAQLGDSDKVIKQKQEARQLAIEALKAQAGPSGVRQINQITSQTQGGGNVVDFNQLPTGRR
jgi:hypothetical protein